MKKIIIEFLLLFRPLVHKLARIYDIPVIEPYKAHGAGKIIFLDPLEMVRHRIPVSTYFNTASGDIHVGEFVVFGENVMLLTGKHLSKAESLSLNDKFSAVPPSGRDIVIEDHAYLGSGAIIVGPCRIGSYAVIGAGAVVTKDVPSNSFVVGNPAFVKKTFSHDA